MQAMLADLRSGKPVNNPDVDSWSRGEIIRYRKGE
jgi:hypothetical protein